MSRHQPVPNRWSIAATCLIVCLSSGCATAARVPVERERLVVENVTSDVIRVYIEVNDRAILVGRVSPMQRAALTIPRGALPAEGVPARLIAVPVGAPAMAVVSGSIGREGYRSDSYHVPDLVRSAWRFSGSRIESAGPRL